MAHEHADINCQVNTVVEPVGYALNNVKTTMVAILERLEAKDYIVYLSGDTNFRDEIAKTKKYKGNRDKYRKPAWYDEIRTYLINTWKAEVVNGIEADDAVADALDEEHKCIVSIDKDLNQIAGWHYNWVKDELYNVEPFEAQRCFWLQMIMGDVTDNIQGIPGYGPKKAEKYLDMFDPHEWEQAVMELYENEYGVLGAANVFPEHYNLIKIGGVDERINNLEMGSTEGD